MAAVPVMFCCPGEASRVSASPKQEVARLDAEATTQEQLNKKFIELAQEKEAPPDATGEDCVGCDLEHPGTRTRRVT